MAEVFLARFKGPEGFEKLAVVKRIRPDYATEESYIRMFLDEARVAAALDHPNICHAYEFGVQAGRYFLTMEYIHGESFASINEAARERGAIMPLGCSLYVVSAVAAALHYAHERRTPEGEPLRIVHRDVSPANIMVAYSGGVKLLDFGIAKALGHSKTTTGVVRGKLSYFSPEQCRGKELDGRSDVFSLGIVLYEATTGQKLFQGNDIEVLNRIANEDVPPPSGIVPDYPPELEEIVMRALARRRDDRYPNAQALFEAIEGFAAKRGLSLSAGQLSSYLQELYGDRVRQPPLQRVLDRSTPQEATVTRPDDVLFVVDDALQPATVKQPRSSFPRWGGAAAALLVVAAVVMFWSFGAAKEDISSSAAASDAALGATAAPVFDAATPRETTVSIVLQVEPEDAVVHHGKKKLESLTLSLPASDVDQTLSVVADGFVSKQVVFVPNQSRTIRVELDPRKEPEKTAVAEKKKKRPRRVRKRKESDTKKKKKSVVDSLVDRSW